MSVVLTTENSIDFEQKKESPALSYERIILQEIEKLSTIYEFLVAQKSSVDAQIEKLNALNVPDNNNYTVKSEYNEQISQQLQEFVDKIQLFNVEIGNKKTRILRLVEANKKLNNSVPEFLKFIKNDYKAVAYKRTEYAKHLELLVDEEKRLLNQLDEVNDTFDEMKSRRHLTYGCLVPHKMNTNVIKPVDKTNSADFKNSKQKSKSSRPSKEIKKLKQNESTVKKVEIAEKKINVESDKSAENKDTTVSKKKTNKSGKNAKNHKKKTKA